jgi:hypothetical protein
MVFRRFANLLLSCAFPLSNAERWWTQGSKHVKRWRNQKPPVVLVLAPRRLFPCLFFCACSAHNICVGGSARSAAGFSPFSGRREEVFAGNMRVSVIFYSCTRESWAGLSSVFCSFFFSFFSFRFIFLFPFFVSFF